MDSNVRGPGADNPVPQRASAENRWFFQLKTPLLLQYERIFASVFEEIYFCLRILYIALVLKHQRKPSMLIGRNMGVT